MPKLKKREPLFPGIDLLGAYGAGLIADHINAFWAARGAVVNAQRYELPHGGGWGVRSNLVGGLPRVQKAETWMADTAAVARHIAEQTAKARRAAFLA